MSNEISGAYVLGRLHALSATAALNDTKNHMLRPTKQSDCTRGGDKNAKNENIQRKENNKSSLSLSVALVLKAAKRFVVYYCCY